ncbi:hypothetical protein, partial [Lysinibacillus fusiformis]|uniref:hypothetical protein n=1 Tax=Lysinibacillus fusiformis TaxID=28031 RepID=UPI0020C033D9
VTRIKTTTGIFEMIAQHCQKIEAVNRDFFMNGLRVLAIAYKEGLPLQKVDTRADRDLIFVGLVAMMDPPRKESKE